MPLSKLLIIALSSFVAGIGAGALVLSANPQLLHTTDTAASTPPAATGSQALGDLAEENIALQQALADARREHERTRTELDYWRQRADNPPPPKRPTEPPKPDTETRDSDAPDPQQWFDENALAALGVPSYEVESIQARFNQYALDKLELRNRARREGWARRPRLHKALKELKQALRRDLGDENYDRMLYASGQANRVEVQDVLPNSAAAVAGVQKGDRILRYGEQRVFTPRTLYDQTTSGEPGTPALLELERDGELITVYVPRGPLGTRFKIVRGKPVQR